jgi:hypothetical protein
MPHGPSYRASPRLYSSVSSPKPRRHRTAAHPSPRYELSPSHIRPPEICRQAYSHPGRIGTGADDCSWPILLQKPAGSVGPTFFEGRAGVHRKTVGGHSDLHRNSLDDRPPVPRQGIEYLFAAIARIEKRAIGSTPIGRTDHLPSFGKPPRFSSGYTRRSWYRYDPPHPSCLKVCDRLSELR